MSICSTAPQRNTKAKSKNPASLEAAPLAYDLPTAARISSLSRSRLYELIAAGTLKSTTIGKRRVIPAESLRALIEKGC